MDSDSDPACHREAASMASADTPGERESKAGSVNLCSTHLRAAIERLEDVRQFAAADSEAAVLHADEHLRRLWSWSSARESRSNASLRRT